MSQLSKKKKKKKKASRADKFKVKRGKQGESLSKSPWAIFEPAGSCKIEPNCLMWMYFDVI